MQDDANTLLRILSTSELKYACVKPATCYGHYVPAALPSFDYRLMQDLHPRNQIWGPQNSLFTGYSNLCCWRPNGCSLQLVSDVNLRVVTAWSCTSDPQHVFKSLLNTDGIQQSVIQLFFCTPSQMYSHVRFLNPSVTLVSRRYRVFFEQCLNKDI